jgi:riboflavin biosynthesis pyrimidine reductase
MDDSILELYPGTGSTRALENLYLGQLDNLPGFTDKAFIYSNFITSLDGRIALPGPDRNSHQVPAAIANKRDWRLFQELAAQADLLVTSARYFRQAADREAQAELPVGLAEDFEDLRDWRIQHGLKPQPDIAIFSSSLDIPLAALESYRDRRISLITGRDVNPTRLEQLVKHGIDDVIFSGGDTRVDAQDLRSQLTSRGYRRVYAIAGPSVLHTLATAGALDRLYLTTSHCLLGGTEFDTLNWGKELAPALQLPLLAVYLDRHNSPDCGQTLAVYGR